MSKNQRGKLSLLNCGSGQGLGSRIFKNLEKIIKNEFDREDREKIKYVKSREVWFANGEVKTIIEENIRGDDLYILQCMDDPLVDRTVNDNLLALFTAIDAAYQSDVDQITVVIPQYPYSRQERKKTREGINAKLIASFLEVSQVERVITVDVHAEGIAGFFRKIQFENLHASRVIIDHFEKEYPDMDFIVVAPDVGSAERARFFSKEFKTGLAIVDKERDYEVMSNITQMRLVGNVQGQNVFMGDDIIDTGGTLINACKLLKENGAKNIYIASTFAFLNGEAIERFDEAYRKDLIKKVIGTDCVFRGEGFIEKKVWYEEVSMGDLIAKVIYNINQKKSVSQLLE